MQLILLASILATLSMAAPYLYLLGDEITGTTGGWIATSGYTGLSKQPTYMQLSMAGNNAAGASGATYTTNRINLTVVSKVRVTLSGYLSAKGSGGTGFQNIYLLAKSSADSSTPGTTPGPLGVLALVHSHYDSSTAETLTNATYELDVAGLDDGSYYIYVEGIWAYQSSTSYIRIESVELVAA